MEMWPWDVSDGLVEEVETWVGSAHSEWDKDEDSDSVGDEIPRSQQCQVSTDGSGFGYLNSYQQQIA